MIESLTCNLCGCRDFEFLFSNLEHASARHASYPRDVCICRSCGLVCLDVSELSEQVLEDYYRENNTFEPVQELFEGHRPMREAQVDWVLRNLPADHGVRTVLDVGCGAGYALHVLKERGFQVWGIDQSHRMIENLKRAWGIAGYQGAFSARKVEREYDLVSCLCALEHMLDPAAVMDELRRAVRPGGFLYLELPDSEIPLWNVVSDHVGFDHLWHWSQRTAARMLETHGFEVLTSEPVQNAWDSGNPEPVFEILGRRCDSFQPRWTTHNDYESMKGAMNVYRRKHQEFLAGFQQKLDAVRARIGFEPIAIFCGGEHTATLLARFDFSGLNVQFILDNDPAIVGRELCGLPIRAGSEASERDVSNYLLSTTNHEHAIYEDLKKADPDCRVFGLYNQLD